MSVSVYVLDRHHKPLMPCSASRARRLLKKGRARIHKLYPFSIRLVDRELEDSELQPVSLKLDPGSRTTGIAIIRVENEEIAHPINFIDLKHRGLAIREALTARRAMRRRRRGTLRYRAKRFHNRTRPKGWLPPSLKHRVDTTLSWVRKLRKLVPITRIQMELVKFDLQKMQKPDITGVEYQRGELYQYEVREYLLEKFQHRCVYCGKTDVPLNIDHIIPKSKGGTNRVSNLVLACIECNQKKSNRSLEEFLKDRPALLKKIHSQLKHPLSDATAVNATRWSLYRALLETGLSVEVATGAQTKYNRHRLSIPKAHHLDALCVGDVQSVNNWNHLNTLLVTSNGRGAYQRTRLTKFGFPRGYLMASKRVKGFATGDMVKAFVLKGKKKGTYFGRVAVRQSGSFNIQTREGTVQGISWRYCKQLCLNDGYGYAWQSHAAHSSPV